MKFFSKIIVLKNLQYRIFAVLVLLVSVFGVRYWQSFDTPTTGILLLHLQPEPETITQKRNLSNYDFGGRISCFVEDEYLPQTCESSKVQARKFILNQLNNKKRAYIILEEDKEYYVFIEPDESNEWRIILNEEVSGSHRGFRKNISSAYAVDVKITRVADYEYSLLAFFNNEGRAFWYF